MFLSWRPIVPVLIGLVLMMQAACSSAPQPKVGQINIAGVYPHLAMMNRQGECGVGAVVPWADRLWVVTYSPHFPMGSDDKLYEVTPDLEQIIRPESVGGTPANRMIHRESNQLIIANYFIDSNRNVRAIQPKDMPGRPTATARHLTDPAAKVYITTMEEGLYEVDVNTLSVKCWINDSNANKHARLFADAVNSALPGYHGKGTYTGQGQLFYANNGQNSAAAKRDPTTPSGALATWGGPGKDWQLILREQFTEVTGPGGIYGSDKPETDPIWAMGWDHRSIILMLFDEGQWHRYRLPKASFSYDGAHGWNTEWPRIREVGTGINLLATMHGTFWHFPKTFSLRDSAGIRPRSNYLKVVGDFARWGEHIVLGCDDSAKKEFLNTRPAKAQHGAPLRSNSNLWFVRPEQLDLLGPALGSGGVWLEEDVKADTTSDPYLNTGYRNRTLHLAHRGDQPVTFEIQIDSRGDNHWSTRDQITVPANGYVAQNTRRYRYSSQWIRIRTLQDTTKATAWFSYANDEYRSDRLDPIFAGLATRRTSSELGGVMRSLGGDDLPLGLIVQNRENDDRPLYLLNEKLELVPSDDKTRRAQTWQAAAPDPEQIPLKIDGDSILVEEDGKRYRLPLSPQYAQDKAFGQAIGFTRRVREVATERDLVNIAGTFYELPARNAGGFSHIRPIASHPYRIHDFVSWRGLFLITGIEPEAQGGRIIKSADGKAAVWAGVVDDLWEMGRPVGIGGPWSQSAVKADAPSDPYLMYGYTDKALTIVSDRPAKITIQIDPSGTGHWHNHETIALEQGQQRVYHFSRSFNAHWVRLVSDTDATVTATLTYE